jgi:hypothetical protein
MVPFNPQELPLTSPTTGCRFVGIVRSRNQTTKFSISFSMEWSPREFDSQSARCCVDRHKWGVDEDLVVVVRFKVLFQDLTGNSGGNVRETPIRIVGNLAKIQVAFLPNITLGYYPTLTCSVSICGSEACKCYHYMPISFTSFRHLQNINCLKQDIRQFINSQLLDWFCYISLKYELWDGLKRERFILCC